MNTDFLPLKIVNFCMNLIYLFPPTNVGQIKINKELNFNNSVDIFKN